MTAADAVGGPASPGPDDWDAHWTRYSEAAAANPAPQYRRRLIERHLPDEPGMRLLDVGSGQGDLSVGLAEAKPDASLVGLELSRTGVEIASKRLPTATFHQVDLLEERPPVAALDRWANAAVCSEVLEHLDRPEVLLRNLRPYLADDAVLVVTVPAGPRNAYERHIGHRRHYTKAALRQLLEDGGYRAERIDAAGFPFFNLYKLMGRLRGDRLIDDADAEVTSPPLVMTLALRAFRMLFAANLPSTPWGWQLIAVARPRASSSSG